MMPARNGSDMRRRAFLASSMVVLPLLTGCSGRPAPEKGGGDGGGGGKQSATVELKKESFKPKKASVGMGGTVTWKNTTDTAHKVTSHRYQTDAADWNFPESPIEAGGSIEHTFEEAGLYQYYSITSGGQYSMCGAVLVGDAPEIKSMC